MGCLLAVVMSWPLATQMKKFPDMGFGDPYLESWLVGWGGHAIKHQPLDYFDANTFFPLRDTLAFSEALIGFAPAGLIGEGPTAAVVRYNLLYLFAEALAFFGAYALARELELPPLASVVAGVAFAYAPWRLDQSTHLHVLSSGGIPLSLALMARGFRSSRPLSMLIGWLIAVWQLSIGFTLGLPFAYLLGVLGFVFVAAWLRKGRPALVRGVVVAGVAGLALFVIWGGLQARPYFRVSDQHPEAVRALDEVTFYSPPLRSLFAASERNILWGNLTSENRASLRWPSEQTLLPGVLVIALAAFGLGSRSLPRQLRLGLLVGIVISGVLAFGYSTPVSRPLYDFLYEYAPGWKGIRTPGRLMTFTSLGLALLAAAGARTIQRTGADQARGDRSRVLVPAILGVLLSAGILMEGAGPPKLSTPLPLPEGQLTAPGPRLELPMHYFYDRVYMYWSTHGYPDLVNGQAGFVPAFYKELQTAMVSFPDPRSVELLRATGVRTVVLHPDLATGTEWESTLDRSIEGLPLRLETRGDIVLYHLDT